MHREKLPLLPKDQLFHAKGAGLPSARMIWEISRLDHLTVCTDQYLRIQIASLPQNTEKSPVSIAPELQWRSWNGRFREWRSCL